MHRADLGRCADFAGEHSIGNVIGGAMLVSPILRGARMPFHLSDNLVLFFCLAAWIGGLVMSIVSLLS